MTSVDDKYLSLLDDIDDDGVGLTDWEANFVDDMLQQGGNFSPNEQSKIREIYDQRVKGIT